MKNFAFAFPSNDDGSVEPGMTLRDWFAAHAPTPTEQWIKDSRSDGHHIVNADAAWRFCWADAMLAERDKAKADDTQDLREALDACISEMEAWAELSSAYAITSRSVIDRAKRAMKSATVNQSSELPEKWALFCDGNQSLVNEFLESMGAESRWKYRRYLHFPFLAGCGAIYVNLMPGYTPITDDQFRQHILNQS